MDLRYNPFALLGAAEDSAARLVLLLDDATLTQHISRYGMGGQGHAPIQGAIPVLEQPGSV